MNTYDSLNDLLQSELNNIIINGCDVTSRNSHQKEILNSHLCLSNPKDILITIPERKFNIDYTLLEFSWYLSQHKNVNNIGKKAKMWNTICDENNEVESNYGTYIIPQWDWIKNELINDSYSRRCTIVFNQPQHKYTNIKDIPCTQYLQFFIRKNKLHLLVYMRSNDIIFGTCNDIFIFCLFQQLMLHELKKYYSDLELGEYYHNVGSLHLYEIHIDKAKSIINTNQILDKTNIEVDIIYDLKSAITKFALPKYTLSDINLTKHIDNLKNNFLKIY